MKLPLGKIALIAASVIGAGCSQTVQTAASTTSGPRTRAERTGYLETSHYDDVIAFLDSLKGRPELTFGSIGKTNEARDIPYVMASRPRVSSEPASDVSPDSPGGAAIARQAVKGPDLPGVREEICARARRERAAIR